MNFLIACESPSASALMRDALRVGGTLAARGHRITYAMADPVAFAEYCTERPAAGIAPAPVLREPPQLIMKQRSPAGFDDVLAIAGFANAAQLEHLCHVWQTQIGLIQPDGIIGFHSPVLWLVGPAFAPTWAAGCGIFLPPDMGAGFPRMSATAAPFAADHVILANANRILDRLRAPPMQAMNGILGRCTEILYGLPVLDPYLQLRRRPSLGPLGEPSAVRPAPFKNRVAAFLDAYCPNVEALLLGLAGTDELQFEIHIKGGTIGMLQFLRKQPNISIWSDHAELLALLPEMSALIHHGDHDVAEAGIVAGRPQLLLPWLPEQSVVVDSFSWMGSVLKSRLSSSIAENAKLVTDFLRNASLTVHAFHHARQIDAAGVSAATERIVRVIETSTGPDLSVSRSRQLNETLKASTA